MASAVEGEAGGGLGSLIRHRDFRLLLIGQGVSGFGDWMGTVALMALVLAISGSSTAVGGVLVLRLAPTVIAGPLAGRLAHRWNRKRTMLAMDLVRIGIVAAVPFVYALWWVYLWAFLLEVAGLVFLPARDASVPDLAGKEDLPLANGLVLGSSYGTIPIGAGAFGVISALAGGHTRGAMYVVFFADAATFLVSFALISRLRSIGREDRMRAEEAGEESEGGFFDALRLPLVRTIAPAALVVSLGLGALFSLGIVYVNDVLDASNTQFGILVALFGVGAAIGLAVLHLTPEENTLDRVRWAVGAQGVVVGGMSMAPAIGWAFVGAVGFGATTAVTLTASMSILQDRLDDQDRVMAFTAFHVVIRAGLAVAAIGAGAFADLIREVNWPLVGRLAPARVVLLASGVIVVVTAIASRRLRERASLQAAR